MADYTSIYKDLTLAAHRAYTRGIQTGSGGNLSARIPGADAMIVKDSGRSFADCTDEGLGWAVMDFDGTLHNPEQKPTREWKLHRFLLQNLPHVGAVVHTHSPWAIAWANDHTEIPCITWHSELKVKYPIPVVDIAAAVVPEEAMDQILALFREQPALEAFMLRGHGLVATGKNAINAEHLAELIEETSQIAVLESLMKR